MSVFTDPYQDSYPPTLWGGGPASTVSGITPATAVVGAAGFTLTVNGSGFTSGSQVSFDGDPRTTTLVSPTRVTAPIATITGVARTVQVTVSTGGSSPFTITAVAEDEPEQTGKKAKKKPEPELAEINQEPSE